MTQIVDDNYFDSIDKVVKLLFYHYQQNAIQEKDYIFKDINFISNSLEERK